MWKLNTRRVVFAVKKIPEKKSHQVRASLILFTIIITRCRINNSSGMFVCERARRSERDSPTPHPTATCLSQRLCRRSCIFVGTFSVPPLYCSCLRAYVFLLQQPPPSAPPSPPHNCGRHNHNIDIAFSCTA